MKSVSKFSLVGLCLIMAFTLSAFFCNGSDLHKANRAAKQVADDLSQCVQASEDLYGQKLIDGNESAAVAQTCSDSTAASDKLFTELQSIKTLDSSNTPQLIQHFADLEADVAKIAPTVGHIKNDKSRARLMLVANSINAGMLTLRALAAAWTQNPPAPAKPVSERPDGNHQVMKADFGPIDGPQGIAFALLGLQWFTSLVAKFIADGKLTDEDLQAAGLGENEDTRNHAARLIAQIRADQAAQSVQGGQAPAPGPESPSK